MSIAFLKTSKNSFFIIPKVSKPAKMKINVIDIIFFINAPFSLYAPGKIF